VGANIHIIYRYKQSNIHKKSQILFVSDFQFIILNVFRIDF